MKRASVCISVTLVILVGIAGQAQCMNSYSGPNACPPPCRYVTVMVPCLKTEMVAQLQPYNVTVPVKKIGYASRKVLVTANPVGPVCGTGPCVRCCPKPCSWVEERKVPYSYCEKKIVPWYRVVYKRVCRSVMVPHTYKVNTVPLCR